MSNTGRVCEVAAHAQSRAKCHPQFVLHAEEDDRVRAFAYSLTLQELASLGYRAVANRSSRMVHIDLPPGANCLLSVGDHCYPQ